MAKRRTRKQKERARKNFKFFIQPEAKNSIFEANVKGQIQKPLVAGSKDKKQVKNAETLAQQGHLATVKKDITRSIIIASFILGIELVLYLALN